MQGNLTPCHSLDSQLKIGNNTWHYRSYGKGQRKIIAFHGYGDSGRQFEPLGLALGKYVELIAVDLPWHGKTEWRAEAFYEKDIHALVHALRRQMSIDRFDLMGFSFGGRVSLKIFSQYKNSLDNLWLLAPDGLHTRHLKIMDNIPDFLQKKMIRWTELRSPHLIRSLSIGKRLGVLNTFQYRFAKAHLLDARKRQRAIGFWKSRLGFEVNQNALPEQLGELQGKVYFFYGDRDKITPGEAGAKLSGKLPNASYFQLSGGHWIIGAVKEFLEEPSRREFYL